jgi:hypothetical protein
MSPNLAASIKARLLQAKEPGEEFERTLTRFAAERLLFRLGASSARDRCILNGASLLSFWLENLYRSVKGESSTRIRPVQNVLANVDGRGARRAEGDRGALE